MIWMTVTWGNEIMNLGIVGTLYGIAHSFCYWEPVTWHSVIYEKCVALSGDMQYISLHLHATCVLIGTVTGNVAIVAGIVSMHTSSFLFTC